VSGAGLVLSGCTVDNADATKGDERSVSVTSTDDSCDVSTTTAPAGTLTFEVANTGSEVTEFYLLGEDGTRIVGEVENIGPGLSRNLVVTAPEGRYYTACKPGMTGKGIRAGFTVTGTQGEVATTQADDERVARATRSYAAYVQDQCHQLLRKTRQFVRLYAAGDDGGARALYPTARQHWERIETVAESFGDLDPKIDAREADLEPGQEWTGWHRIEKDLWPPAGYQQLTSGERREYGRGLLADTRTLDRRIRSLDFSLDQIANGSVGLLEEVATGKVTGEEETWSHTDLWDFQANLDGARVGYLGVRPVLVDEDKPLASTLDRRFAQLQALLDAHRRGDGFVSYQQLTDDEVKELADAVNALSEPLSRLTATVVG
jgi:iron uptake system component EfeO